MLVGIFNLLFCLKIIRTINENSITANISDRGSQLRSMLNQDEDEKETKKQLYVLGIGGFVCSVIRLIRVIVSYILIKHSKNYVCSQNLFYKPMSSDIAVFLWFKAFTNFGPTLVLFYVIYYVPNQEGKIKQINLIKHDTISLSQNSANFGEDSDEKGIRETDISANLTPVQTRKTVSGDYDINKSFEGQRPNSNKLTIDQ